MDKAMEKVVKQVVFQVLEDFWKIVFHPATPKMFEGLKDLWNTYQTIPDKIFLVKLTWCFDKAQRMNLSDEEKEKVKNGLDKLENKDELYFRLYDLINRAYSKQHIHYIINAMTFALEQSCKDKDYISKFYSIVATIQRTDIDSLQFLIEKIEKETTYMPDILNKERRRSGVRQSYYKADFESSSLQVAGLMSEYRQFNEGTGKINLKFTPLAYQVYEYITCGATRK